MNALSTNRQKLKALCFIVAIAMSGLLGIDIQLPSLPHIMHFMQSNKIHMQQSVSLYLLGMGISLLIYGPLSDRIGRKPVVIFGLTLACIASFASVLTHHITPFLITRFFQGVGAGACAGLGRTMAVDILHDAKGLSSARYYYSTVISLSPLLGPLIGGYLQHYFNWQANFIFLSGLFVILLFIYGFFCPETNQHINKKTGFNKMLVLNYIQLLKNPIFICATLICGITLAALIIYATLSPFIFQIQYHLSVIAYGWITASVAIGALSGRVINAIIAKRMGNLGALRIGILLLLFSGLFLVLLNLFGLISIFLLLFAVFITLCGQSFTSVNTMFIALKPHHDKRGIAGSLFGGFQMLVTCLTASIISLFAHEGVALLGGAFLGLGLISYFLYFRLSITQEFAKEIKHS